MKNVITGCGIIGPSFSAVNRFSEILFNGECVVKKRVFNNESYYIGEVEEDTISDIGQKEKKRYPKQLRMLLHACKQAVEEAEIHLNGYRTAVIVGTSAGQISEIERNALASGSCEKRSPYSIGNMNSHSLSTSINAAYGLNGMSFTLSNSCTSSLDALHLADILLTANQVDLCIVGGVDSPICQTVLDGFSPLKVLQNGREYSGPFSNGKGFSMSEGAGVIIAERFDIANKRRAKSIGVIESVCMTQDAVSPYLSDPTGNLLLQAVDHCLLSGFPSYINSQALGILENDRIEEMIYQKRFLNAGIPLTSIKGMVGHSMGASGIFQLISSLISMKENFIPPTIPACISNDLPISTSVLSRDVQSVLITAHGYGGNNCAALISKGDT
ncbi:hypothetical protein CEF21_07165 [Bacillus sp. FJAT-42376]|uniref:beta-ketoacyl synthase N-terminal-like domain-containing protein n=1 Tax=Bacillus sp. FJAT-42376 TaxID=2014076 RepID=UPI000F4E83F3|nr:beta-ketoacyl synthase N-terminal-like domain-containing protein [Bacillus sp. FJAT-42376]AZB42087.1 hypothetical protein CEF21_07165 [Bacillus sp. FJAT-42376]